MTGTVAVGTALTGATVTVTDANGKTASATSGANGAYSVSLAGLSAPLLITAADPSGVSGTLYSVVASANTTNGTPVTANVTPLTTAVAALMTQSGNPADLAGNASAITSSAVTAAEATLDAAIAPILSANSVTASFDPIGSAFTPNQAGADAVIDSVAVTPSVSGSGLQITSLANPDTAIQLNSSTSVSTALAPPSHTANYLSGLQASLSACASDVQGGARDTSDSNCTSAIDASYLNNGVGAGVAGFAKRHTLFTKGTVLTGIKTVAFVPAGTLAGINNPAALVYLLMTDPDGTPDYGLDYVQQLPNGQWDIIGNQLQDSTSIASFLGRVQYADSADAGNARYESGLDIQIPSSVKVNGTATGVGSALVTGPGLPSSGLWLQTAGNGTGAGYLEIPAGTLTAPLTSVGNRVSGGMSTAYKWAWAPLSGSTTSFSPNGLPEYASSSQNVSTISNFGIYTVTLYDTTGTEIRSEQVQNIARNYAAAAGGTVAWQTLGNDVIANYLTPGGSGTQNAPGTSATLDWTTPTGSFYPNFWASINSLGTAQNGVPTTTYDATVWGASTGNTPSPLTFNTPFTDVLTSTASATAEQAVQVQLGWAADGEKYLNTWQYGHP
ncbi:cell wall surface anchor family protein [Burkholderia pseudomallei]|uniref:cell wall anchor protein n=1 Tax=Burkholderia pseudomallei TaxID=28450 RepID=UPI000F25D8AD|nr:cell wall anchor protein [Burkholderia pseudomallei]CAJ3047783.1 cell wall surface anchor family protein [Burkholderia pseudomallei]CAJ3565786.1 cell wall surface anchor family protein [Burkholderia pseudomallei]CAJ3757555.1 cell wall surface anchor family protein [Burkholderia pseudomallei]CAJ3813017.1 cell wall surface anchor family protein [Burkholderia pseudomallei]CAJ3981078.1 cell wall surface anchor family protein [Burkholderia pseudomallei]